MSIKYGELDLGLSALDLEYRVLILEAIVETALNKNPTFMNSQEIEAAKARALKTLQDKYPTMGIVIKS